MERKPLNASANSSGRALSSDPKKAEERIQLAFRTKRANVYTANALDPEEEVGRVAYSEVHIPKSAKHLEAITSAFSKSYMFASLTKPDIESLACTMGMVDVAKGENIITQGETGDYLYVLESGEFSVIVDNQVVSSIEPGVCFGELALLYNAPRQATVRATTDALVFSLEREAYRYIVAQSSSGKNMEIQQALSKVPLLSSLTEGQMDKLCEAVEIFPYKEGDVIIQKGSEGNVFYMIKEGSVDVSEMGEKFANHTLSEGEYFGERALITGEPRAATITAKSPTVLLMALDRDAFISLLGPLKELLDFNMNLRVLTSVKIFANLSEMEINKLATSFELVNFLAGKEIIKQGDKGSTFYILKDGSCTVIADGTTVGTLTQGNYFGEMALLDDEVRKATVQATVDCECFQLDRDVFVNILGSMHSSMDQEISQRLKKLKANGGQKEEPEPMLQLKFSDLKYIAMLGSGTFGRVSLVQDKNTTAVYALKAMHKSDIVANKQQANTINEKNVMIQCKHTFILRLYQTFKDSKKLYMVLEFIQGGELFSVLHSPQGDGVPESHAKFYGAAVFLALEYLHSKEIAYRDMKPENCLIDKHGYPKLVDFGFAKKITGKTYTLCGTPEYLAPELVLAKGHNKAVDYWAFGILLYEMIAGYSPFCDPKAMDQVVICQNIVKGRLVFPRNFNNDCKELVKGLLARDVSTRLGNLKGGCDDIKKQKWYQNFSFDDMIERKFKAPWLPKVTSTTDISNFDQYPVDDEVDPNYVDRGNWDKDF